MTAPSLRLFEATGVELEYMIVDPATLSVKPVADVLLEAVSGRRETEVELGPISWSNELALHLIELKTTDPVPSLGGLAAVFQEHVGRIQTLLAPLQACLLPTAMHPWMAPQRELRLWPHENDVIYATFDRIFDCRGHGWANLQSVHVNLPFSGDAEFGRLHAAIRMVLPIVPGLAASSPIVDGRTTGLMDTRLEVYRHNADRVPSVAGRIVPEPIFTQAEYESGLLGRIYDDLAPLDPEGVLRHEWVNARGCIARFDRMSIEIRVIDAQECPLADVAVVAAIVAAVRGLVEERWSGFAEQRGWSEDALAAILLEGIRRWDHAIVRDEAFLGSLGYRGVTPCRMRDLWQHLIEATIAESEERTEWGEVFRAYGRHGCLARRIAAATGPEPERDRLHSVYGQLAECLARGRVFEGLPS